jgi:hypothetical protein
MLYRRGINTLCPNNKLKLKKLHKELNVRFTVRAPADFTVLQLELSDDWAVVLAFDMDDCLNSSCI